MTIHKLKTAGAEDETDLETLSYTYDANGNIKTVSVNGVLQDKYAYDYLGQLVRHDDATANKSFYYTYDEGGNITKKREYAYTTGTLSNPTSTINYTYDTTWKDKLISYNGNAITYDEIGNPLTYNGYTFSWQKGRQLATISGNGVELSFKYNADGLRTEKTNGTTTTQYYYSGTVLLAQYSGGNYLKFLYSADGELICFMKNNTPYYYIKNQQGDVLYIYNNAGSLVSEYRYDAWGNCTVLKANGTVDTDPTSIGNMNPIRYRGYYYDSETGFYYVSSRYYDTELCRFLNADSLYVLDVQEDLYDKNLYSYCDNNPVARADSDGEWWHLAVGAAVGVVTQFIADVGIGLATGSSFGEIMKSLSPVDYVSAAIGGAIAASGIGIVGAIVSNAALGGTTYLANCSYKGVEANTKDFVASTAIGGAFGAISGPGANGKNMRGVYSRSKQVINATKSARKQTMYKAKITTLKKKVTRSSVRMVVTGILYNVVNFVRRFFSRSEA